MKKTVFVMGAGSTAYLGLPMTKVQEELLQELNGDLLGNLKTILDGTFGKGKYSVNDVYNVIDSNLLLHNALRFENVRIETYELEKCKKDLISFLFKHFLENIKSTVDDEKHRKLISFYRRLAEIELKKKQNCSEYFEKREEFISSYSIINFNWDLYSLLPILEANSEVNHVNDHYLSIGRNPQLRVFTDFNCEYAAKENEEEYWYPFTEPAAFIANSRKYDSTRRVLLTKCFLPHGAMNLFKCTACAKHSYYLGNLTVKSVASKINYSNNEEAFLYKCPYCKEKIYSRDYDVLVQSNFKVRNSFLEEIRLSMMEQLRKADRLIFIGYSMPNDDVDYITMFKSLYKNLREVFVVLSEQGAENRFVTYKNLATEQARKDAENYEKVFGDSVKYNMAGFPDAIDEILKIVEQP